MFVEVFVGVRHQTRFLEPPYAPCPFVWRHPFFFIKWGQLEANLGREALFPNQVLERATVSMTWRRK